MLASPAFAHPGHGPEGLTGGLLHPLLGIDHLAAMIASGLWAAAIGGRARIVGPAAFIGGMTLGAAIGVAGFALPAVETMIALSVIILGLLATGAARFRLAAALPLFALAGLFHGNAHGLEAQTGGTPLAFVAGMIATTAGLHLAGIGFGRLAGRHPTVLRVAGLALSGTGVALLVG
jgi:urease accessory protein